MLGLSSFSLLFFVCILYLWIPLDHFLLYRLSTLSIFLPLPHFHVHLITSILSSQRRALGAKPLEYRSPEELLLWYG